MDSKAGPAVGVGAKGEAGVVLLENVANEGEAYALAVVFGREEGREELGGYLGRNAEAVVGKDQRGASGCGLCRGGWRCCGLCRGGLGAQQDGAGGVNGLHGIFDNIDKHLFHQYRVKGNETHFRGEIRFQGDLFAHAEGFKEAQSAC